MTWTRPRSKHVERWSGTTEHGGEKQVRCYDPDLTSKVVRDGTKAGARALHDPPHGMWSASEALDQSSMTSGSDLGLGPAFFRTVGVGRGAHPAQERGIVSRAEMVRSVSVPWETQFDLQTEWGADVRTVLSDLHDVEAARITFVDEKGAELRPRTEA